MLSSPLSWLFVAPTDPSWDIQCPKNLTAYNLKIATPKQDPWAQKKMENPVKSNSDPFFGQSFGFFLSTRPQKPAQRQKPAARVPPTEFQGKAARRYGAPRWRHDVAAARPAKRRWWRCVGLAPIPIGKKPKSNVFARIGVFSAIFLFWGGASWNLLELSGFVESEFLNSFQSVLERHLCCLVTFCSAKSFIESGQPAKKKEPKNPHEYITFPKKKTGSFTHHP